MPAPDERINRFLARCGEGSRRTCEDLVRAGRVSVDGQVVRNLAQRVELGQRVTVDGRRVQPADAVVFAFHKPAGLLCTRDDPQRRETIYDALPSRMRELHYVGRLDRDSEGLLLLTNDGEISQWLTHPRHAVEKEYLVTLDRSFDPEDSRRLIAGIKTEEGLAKAVSVHLLSPRRVVVVLRQGLKRQVRLMFAGLNYRVKRLLRVRIGRLTLEELAPGRWRQLNSAEIAALVATAQAAPGEGTAAGGSAIGSGSKSKSRRGSDKNPADGKILGESAPLAEAKQGPSLDPALIKRSAKVEKELRERKQRKQDAAARKIAAAKGEAPIGPQQTRKTARPTRNSHLKGNKSGAKRWKRH